MIRILYWSNKTFIYRRPSFHCEEIFSNGFLVKKKLNLTLSCVSFARCLVRFPVLQPRTYVNITQIVLFCKFWTFLSSFCPISWHLNLSFNPLFPFAYPGDSNFFDKLSVGWDPKQFRWVLLREMFEKAAIMGFPEVLPYFNPIDWKIIPTTISISKWRMKLTPMRYFGCCEDLFPFLAQQTWMSFFFRLFKVFCQIPAQYDAG